MQAEGGETCSRSGVSWVLEETNTEREVVIDIKCTQELKVKDRVGGGWDVWAQVNLREPYWRSSG